MEFASSIGSVDGKVNGPLLGIWVGDKVDEVKVVSSFESVDCKADGLSLGIRLW